MRENSSDCTDSTITSPCTTPFCVYALLQPKRWFWLFPFAHHLLRLMARWPRIAAHGFPMHLTQRGNNHGITFLDDDDFANYRNFLHHASVTEGCAIHAYALMSNHTHILMTPSSGIGASRMMQTLGRLYVRYFNSRHRRSGTLWDGRFKSSVIDTSAYFLMCSRYIDLNPVRAGMVATPDAYEWSSFARLGLGRRDQLVTLHDEYLALGTTATLRTAAYRELCRPGQANGLYPVIRRAIRTGSALGRQDFCTELSQRLKRPVQRASHGGARVRMHSVDGITGQDGVADH